MSEHRYGWIVNNFLHDLCTGMWAACLLVVVVLDSRQTGMPAQASAALGETMWLLFWLAIASLVVIGVTGAVRLVYWRRQAAPDELVAKRRALIAKHVAYLVVYGAGTVWLWLLVQ